MNEDDPIVCGACRKELPSDVTAPDPCLGVLPGVAFACCGHGEEEGYILFENGVRIGFHQPKIELHVDDKDPDKYRKWRALIDSMPSALLHLKDSDARQQENQKADTHLPGSVG